MSEQPKPPRGAFDWMLPSVEQQFDMPINPEIGPGIRANMGTLRVVITAKATVSPNRAWGLFIVIWASVVVGLLASIMVNTAAHGAENWQPGEARRFDEPAWGALEPGRTTTYREYQVPGRQGRCAFSRWRGDDVRMTCN